MKKLADHGTVSHPQRENGEGEGSKREAEEMKERNKALTPKQQAAVERMVRARAARDALRETMREEPPATPRTAQKPKE